MSSTALNAAPSTERNFYLGIGVVSAAAVGLLAWILILRSPPPGDAAALAFMPAVNAAMNALSASCLVMGFIAIRTKRVPLHRGLMLSALGFSALFLVGYLAYHFVHGDTHYPEGAPLRTFYLAMLASHVILSIVCFPMVLITFGLALRGQVLRHRKIAKWTLPIWLYVSVTGVAVFVMLRSVL
jgi:putative membrane protein